MSCVRFERIDRGAEGQRLDRWLRRRFPGIGQARIQKFCRKGQLRLDGKRVKASTRLSEGQVLRVPPIPKATLSTRRSGSRFRIPDKEAAAIRSTVIYRDTHLLALNKPHGLASQGGTGLKRHVDGLRRALRFGKDEDPKLVHRLDRETSGVLLLARSRRCADRLATAFRRRQTGKFYWAVVWGRPRRLEGEIKFSLSDTRGGSARRTHCGDPVPPHTGYKSARTRYRVIDALGKAISLLLVSPVTGRKHQIRAHLSALGHPIVGDVLYTGDGEGQAGPLENVQESMIHGQRDMLHLHASAMMLKHPMKERTITIEADLPVHMAATCKAVEWSMTRLRQETRNAASNQGQVPWKASH